VSARRGEKRSGICVLPARREGAWVERSRISAGTDPDGQVAPAIANHLKKNGYEVPVLKPRLATAEDIATADVVISIGCDLKGLPAPRGTVVTWDDMPSTSAEFARADERIRERVAQLMEEFVRKRQR
jgi:protein-tyrosine-phosphatase